MSTTELTVTSESPESPIQVELTPYVSPTLERLPKNLRPNPSTVCEACPASVWFSVKDGVQCYCRVMHLKTYTSEEPTAMTACDGEVMANLQRAADAGL